MEKDKDMPTGFIVGIVGAFLKGPLSIMLILAAIILGVIAITSTPREEEPQIVVPTVDISVSFPGHSPQEVEQLVTRPLERLIWQVDGIEHVYSISRQGGALVTARFYVGQDRERSMVKIRDKIEANRDIIPPGVTNWIVKPVEIDDVPIVSLTLFSVKMSPLDLRRVAEEYSARLDKVKNVSKSEIIGGNQREIRIEPNIEKMASLKISFDELVHAIQSNNLLKNVGNIVYDNKSHAIKVDGNIDNVKDIENIIIPTGQAYYDMIGGVGALYKQLYKKDEIGKSNHVVKIADIAKVVDGPVENSDYTSISFGPASEYYKDYKGESFNAVTLAFSKKRGTNAVTVAQDIIKEAKILQGKILPSEVKVIVTRNYGEIANNKVNSLIESMIFAIITVVILLYFSLGWKESLVVGLAVPISFAMALFVNYLFGYTINRVTLFALILSLGLVVDDPITNVDNIQRHIRMGKESAFKATLIAVHEVLPPVIISTIAIIISFTPMFFITGMMGPYMGPMAINVPLTVTFSTVCALTFVPWVAYKLLRKDKAGEEVAHEKSKIEVDVTPKWIRKNYKRFLLPLIQRKKVSYSFLGIVVLLMIISAGLLVLKVPLKMLPFDNKDELQLIVDLPYGSSLEQSERVNKALEKYLTSVNEVKDVEVYTGINSPVDFNGLIRRYNLRKNSHTSDIRINLASKTERSQQSHGIALRIRPDIQAIADKYNAKVKIVEVPPGPPVISTLTAEIRGKEDMEYQELIDASVELQGVLNKVDGDHIVEVDDMSETPHTEYHFVVDKDKAAATHVNVNDIYRLLATAVSGNKAGIAHVQGERNPLMININLNKDDRASIKRLSSLWIKNRDGNMVQLSELGKFVEIKADQPIYHKNMERVVYLTAECAGRAPGEVVLETMMQLKKTPLKDGISTEWAGEGEWEITLRVFRDLGIAFGVALIGIYILMVAQMKSFFMPIIVMMAIPLTIIGIAPGFYFLNLIAGGKVGIYPDPIFFTATAMIGMIALGGVVIRNSLVLIEFVQESTARGNSLKDALLESGAVRFRPIILTAMTTMLGAWPITFDPVFSGLAWALIFGLLASTAFTLLVIPVVYYLIMSKKEEGVKV